uniref:Protein lin-41-like n=1 Tax=Phallusia mammillata TaxID=59560 RepID=A0A6F9DW49_9ASCI|nr:protein lin-41-like [Phallusia mammillata]
MGGTLTKRHVTEKREDRVLRNGGKSKNGNFSQKRRHIKQVKRDRKSQRLTREQLYRLSNELKHTSWYLGRSLHLSEKQVRKVLLKLSSTQQQKYALLIHWRAQKGWKATAQALVINLELAGYDYDEYKSIVMSQSDGNLGVYDKAPEIGKSKKENYRYDDYANTDALDTARSHKEKVDDIKASMDFAIFLRKSWKKPSGRENVNFHNDPCTSEDSGIVTSPNVSSHVTDSTSGEMEPDPPKRTVTVRRCSDSTITHSFTSSPRHNSETELNRIFENGSAIGGDRVNKRSGATNLPKRKTDTSLRLRHNSQPSVESRDLECQDDQQYTAVQKGQKSRETCITFGGRGKYPSRFRDKISGLSLTREQDIVVSDSDNLRIQIFDRFGNFKHAFDTESELKPKGVFVTHQGDILVCCGSEIRIFSISGELKMTFGQGTFRNNSYGICSDVSGNYYVTDIVGHTVSVYDAKGDIRKRFGYLGQRMMNFNQPVALAISKRGELLISDTQNHTVKVYSLAGRPLYAIGGKGTGDGQFWNPFGICFDTKGFLYVADCGNDRISVFDSKYKFLRHVITSRDGLKMPSFVQITASNQLVVSEWNSQQIKIYALETAV